MKNQEFQGSICLKKLKNIIKVGQFYILPLDTLYETTHAEFEDDRQVILVFTDWNDHFDTNIQYFSAYNVKELESQHISNYSKTINRTAASVGSKNRIETSFKMSYKTYLYL